MIFLKPERLSRFSWGVTTDMTGAVIAKPSFKELTENSAEIKELLESFTMLYTFKEMGGEYFDRNFKNTKSADSLTSKGYVERFNEIAQVLVNEKADVLVTVGGDGIASYSAGAIIKTDKNHKIGIIGYPAGTANIGPIVQNGICKESLETYKELDAIEVSCNGHVLGYGFNDVILGSSLLGTINDTWANVNAQKLARDGVVEECIPCEKAVTEDFSLTLNGKQIPLQNWKGRIAQICISTLHQDNLNGRAVTGGLGESIGFEHPAALAILDKISVDAREETWNSQVLRTTSHICFNEKDTLTLKGFEKETCVIIDGNPFIIEGNELIIKCKANAIPVYGCGGKNEK